MNSSSLSITLAKERWQERQGRWKLERERNRQELCEGFRIKESWKKKKKKIEGW